MRWLPRCLSIALFFCLISAHGTQAAESSPAGAMLKLLQSGRVPEQRLPTIVKLICERGNAADLEVIFAKVASAETWSADLRAQTLGWLATAARERKVLPAGDLSSLAELVHSPERQIQQQAVELAGLWKVAAAKETLLELARGKDVPLPLRQSALDSITRVDRGAAVEILRSLVKADQPFLLRSLAASVLAQLELNEAATAAAAILKDCGAHDDPAPLLEGFLGLKGGSAALAQALNANAPAQDTAKLLLRHMYSVGRTDADLSQTLSRLAGISQSTSPPTKEQIAALTAEVARAGDPVRGEAVFRRKDLSCMNCHAVSKAGGQIGPDLSAVGASSPVEYVVTSVLDPDQAIKEAFTTKVVVTQDGKILQGIVADRTADALVLKAATGQLISIPVHDIDEEIEGKSLMPKGLVNLMTHAEFLDLAAFLSELGKPGRFAIRTGERMQRYRLLSDVPESLLQRPPTLSDYEDLVLHSTHWAPFYARVNGEVPLDELSARTEQDVFYLRGDVNCSSGGAAEIQLDSAAGVTIWLDDHELPAENHIPIRLERGDHAIVLRVDRTQRSESVLTLQLSKPADASTQFVVVDGK
jgi:putative heme-binding domain-containing protein